MGEAKLEVGGILYLLFSGVSVLFLAKCGVWVVICMVSDLKALCCLWE